ncbi:MAG: hypothetical protein K6U11_05360 [bacterium]|nr:hypothetical protein [bacterium]
MFTAFLFLAASCCNLGNYPGAVKGGSGRRNNLEDNKNEEEDKRAGGSRRNGQEAG